MAAALLATPSASADPVKIGILKTTGAGPTFIAIERSYFAAEGLTPELVPFEAPQPVAVGVASGGST